MHAWKRWHGKLLKDVFADPNAFAMAESRLSCINSGEGFVFFRSRALRTKFFRATIEREDVDPKELWKGSGVIWAFTGPAQIQVLPD